MSRAFTPQHLIPIPTRSAHDTLALHSRLLVAARAAGAPPELMELIEDMEGSGQRLHSQLVARQAAPGLDTKRAVAADRKLDAAWSGLRDWVIGWVKLGEDVPRASEIRELYNFLFGTGLAFLNDRFDSQWAESNARLETLRSGRHAELVRALGGGPIVDALLAANDAYGQALGTTAELPAPIEAKVREALDDLLASMREYVIAVGATVRRKRPETAALAEQLLRPLLEWRAPSSRGGRTDDPAAPEPADDPSDES